MSPVTFWGKFGLKFGGISGILRESWTKICVKRLPKAEPPAMKEVINYGLRFPRQRIQTFRSETVIIFSITVPGGHTMFFPLGDDNSSRRSIPIVVWIILGINIYVWYLQLSLGEHFTNGYAVIPYEIVNSVDLLRPTNATVSGRDFTIVQATGPSPIQWTLLSAMFMHGSWPHIIGNMLYLLIFGDQIEDLLGKFRFIFFYLACGVFASLAHIFSGP